METEPTGAARLFVARLVSAHHLAVLVFLLVGWALPWTWSLWTALAVYPLVQLSWCCFGNRCLLSVLEEKLRSAAASDAAHQELHFVQRLCNGLLGRPVSRAWADLLAYAAVWGGFALTSLRLYFRT